MLYTINIIPILTWIFFGVLEIEMHNNMCVSKTCLGLNLKFKWIITLPHPSEMDQNKILAVTPGHKVTSVRFPLEPNLRKSAQGFTTWKPSWRDRLAILRTTFSNENDRSCRKFSFPLGDILSRCYLKIMKFFKSEFRSTQQQLWIRSVISEIASKAFNFPWNSRCNQWVIDTKISIGDVKEASN